MLLLETQTTSEKHSGFSHHFNNYHLDDFYTKIKNVS